MFSNGPELDLFLRCVHLDSTEVEDHRGPMLYEAAEFAERAAQATILLFTMIVLFGALAIMFFIGRYDYYPSTTDCRDGLHGICNDCGTERFDINPDGYCRVCLEDLEARAW